MREEIAQYKKKLRLSSSLMDIYPNIKAETHEEFLLILLRELNYDREEKRKIRNLNNAGFLVLKSLADYDYSQIRFPDSLNIRDLESLSFVNKKENLMLVHDLINQLESNDEKIISSVYKKIKQADLLILDEWGYLPLHQEGARLPFEIISICYETKSIIITTNIEFGRWKGFLFDEKLTAAIVDRLVHHSHMLIFAGQSYRMTNLLIK